MGPDLLWVIVFVLGGGAIGLITSFVGLRKGRELWYWLGLYALMLAAIIFLQVDHPFWTMLVGALAAGVTAGAIQAALLPRYRRHNPWFTTEPDKTPRKVALGLVGFTVTVGALFGVVMGSIAWGLSGLF